MCINTYLLLHSTKNISTIATYDTICFSQNNLLPRCVDPVLLFSLVSKSKRNTNYTPSQIIEAYVVLSDRSRQAKRQTSLNEFVRAIAYFQCSLLNTRNQKL